jgi:hypothetical protein
MPTKTNPQAYYENPSITAVKCFITLGPGVDETRFYQPLALNMIAKLSVALKIRVKHVVKTQVGYLETRSCTQSLLTLANICRKY